MSSGTLDSSTLAAGEKLVGSYRGTQYQAEIVRIEPFAIRVEGLGDYKSLTAACNALGAKDSGARFWARPGDRSAEAKAPRAGSPAGPVRVRQAIVAPISITRLRPEAKAEVKPDYCAACNCRVALEEGACANCKGAVGVDPGTPFYCTGCRETFYAQGEDWPEACPAGHRDAALPEPVTEEAAATE